MPSVHRRVYWLGLAPTYDDFSFLRRGFLSQGKAEQRLDLNDMSIKKGCLARRISPMEGREREIKKGGK